MRQVWRVAWYRFRATFGRRWGGLLAIVLLIGLVGGLSMTSIGAARRTQASYPAFLASTHPSDLSVIDYPTFFEKVAHLRGVKHAETVALLNAVPLGPNGSPRKEAAAAGNVFPVGSVDGLLFDQDRATAIQGRMADPKRVDEGVMTADAAKALGLRVGDVVPLGFYDGKQKLRARVDVKMVGIVVLNDAVVQDDTQRSLTYVVLTPALTASLKGCCSPSFAFTGLALDGGSRQVAAVEAEYEQLLPADSSFYLRDASVTEAKAERAIEPESIALGVFGLIAALAALLIAGQLIGRQLSGGADDLDVMRALGATPSMTEADGLLGVLGAIVGGAFLAALVAVGLSPLSPIGPVRAVYPSRGIAFDWTVLGLGVAVLIAASSAFAVVIAYRAAPHRVAHRSRSVTTRPSTVASAAAASGLSAPAVTGVRFASESGRGPNAVPVRSAILGAALAIVVVVATVTFGASLRTLISHPALYGWNWNYELETGEGGGAIPLHTAATLLGRDNDVSGWTGVYFDSLRVDDLTVPILGGNPNAAVQPPLLSGHGFDATNQIVLGPTTLAQLHKHIGDTVEASYATCVRAATCPGTKTRTSLLIVGTATMPAVGPALGLHASMGTGALVSDEFLPHDLRVQGPNALFVRIKAGAQPTASLPALQRIASALSTPGTVESGSGTVVSVLSVQRPAEIVNYRSMGDTPVLLGTALALGAISALALTLITSVRRRRRDLALLKTLGFTRRQLVAVIAWQSTVAVAIGIAVGVPVGIVTGRTLWNLFARQINAVPHPSVPVPTIALVAIGAVVLANLVAAIPGLQAARTPTALLLHAE